LRNPLPKHVRPSATCGEGRKTEEKSGRDMSPPYKKCRRDKTHLHDETGKTKGKLWRLQNGC
ncbi:MAG: hypothetical protein ABI690_28710, partial [Chloroflexota bacterium]